MQPDLSDLDQAVDFYFEISLYLLVLLGFVTLASTGGLDLPSIFFTSAAIAVRGYFLARRRHAVIPERWTTPLTLGYFAFFTADYFSVSHGFLPATVHLALFAVVIRMFSLRRERDYITLAILAFLMILASAVLTVDTVFLFSFAGFLLMAVVTSILMEMRRSARSASIQAHPADGARANRRLALALARVGPALVLMILIAGAAVFFLLPRMSSGYLGAYSFGTDFSSGFSDHVQLGQIGEIQQSNAVVMHVQIDGDTSGFYDLRWRGVALSDFDGHMWSKPQNQYILEKTYEDSFTVPELENKTLKSYITTNQARQKLIHYRVLMEPIGTNVFFLAPWSRRVSGNYRLLAADSAGAVFDLDVQHPISRYEAVSDIATPTAAELRSAGRNFPPRIALSYLRLPPVDPRVPQLARQITSSATNDFDRATAIESYLRTRYGYTLQLPQRTPKDPIANFLFERKQGHCEYFASSMAVLLRTLGIPARMVNGFRSDEFNDLTGYYVIRAKDAHAWVEAYFPGYGWHTFDPTPAGQTGTPQGWRRLALYVDAMASFWREWIVSYDSSHQLTLGQAAISSTRSLWESSRTWARSHYNSMLKWARRSQDRVEASPRRWLVIGLAIVLVVLVFVNLDRILRAFRERGLRAHPGRLPQKAAAMWYERMTRVVARNGLSRSPAQTPREFLGKIADDRLHGPVERFTVVYESARFGNSAEDAAKLPELYEEVILAARER
jgi:protein-glutamine gamma-glutamyltransferase